METLELVDLAERMACHPKVKSKLNAVDSHMKSSALLHTFATYVATAALTQSTITVTELGVIRARKTYDFRMSSACFLLCWININANDRWKDGNCPKLLGPMEQHLVLLNTNF